MTSWRIWALIVGAIVSVGGIFLWSATGNPMFLIFGLLLMVTAALEPLYGRPNGRPVGNAWRPTDERFVDPETGKLVTVWFDPETGQRRYVEDAEHIPSS